MKKNKKGFTLIELMVVIVIIGILVAIALPNFIAAQDRAKVSSVKANMHTFQAIVETYAVDWGGLYPDFVGGSIPSAGGLYVEATTKGYWKDFSNPFRPGSTTGMGLGWAVAEINQPVTNNIDSNNCQSGFLPSYGNDSVGMVAYDHDVDFTPTKYYIYGGAKEVGKCITDKGRSFSLTNN
ncbi:MAG: type II secretion system protein [Candidatus Sericytochromatia bacterium]